MAHGGIIYDIFYSVAGSGACVGFESSGSDGFVRRTGAVGLNSSIV